MCIFLLERVGLIKNIRVTKNRDKLYKLHVFGKEKKIKAPSNTANHKTAKLPLAITCFTVSMMFYIHQDVKLLRNLKDISA